VRSQRFQLLITQAYERYVYVAAKTMSGKGQDDAVVPQGAAVPRGRSCGQTENNHPAHAEGGEPRAAINCAMPRCLA
jgi:hypothetical protein